ncbi:MAG TPA: hypothetical protein VFT87_03050 [Candidatus Saccharimonadales bacterium]|nr:hypothetical protein [Candidatus Saccharimonadales bacterium]
MRTQKSIGLSLSIAGLMLLGLAACSNDQTPDNSYSDSANTQDALVAPDYPVLRSDVTLADGRILKAGQRVCLYFLDRSNGEVPQEAAQAACGNSGIPQDYWVEEALSGQADFVPPARMTSESPDTYVYTDNHSFLLYLWLYHSWYSRWYHSSWYYDRYVHPSYRSHYTTRYISNFSSRYGTYLNTYNQKATYRTSSGATTTCRSLGIGNTLIGQVTNFMDMTFDPMRGGVKPPKPPAPKPAQKPATTGGTPAKPAPGTGTTTRC